MNTTPQISLPKEPRVAKFKEGEFVIALDHLYNDGSHPDSEADTLLIAAGGPGEIVQVGRHGDSDTPIYMVDFGLAVVGCLEEEIALHEGADVEAIRTAALAAEDSKSS